jgi:hypothetical protein
MTDDDATARLALPLLYAAQAQKEDDHNEALAQLDLATQAVVQDVGIDEPPAAPALGACWIVGSAPTGAWSGRAGALAGWTAGGWRFVAAFTGMAVWDLASNTLARRGASQWERGSARVASVSVGGLQVVGARRPAIAAPAGGTTVDSEARAALGAVLAALRTHGLIAS